MLPVFQVLNLSPMIPPRRNDVVFAWSDQPAEDVDFTLFLSIPNEPITSALLDIIQFLDPASDIHSISMKVTGTALDGTAAGRQQVYLPTVAVRYWLDIHKFIPIRDKVQKAKLWIDNNWPYQSQVASITSHYSDH
jgi:hypothetical protein